jgi:hypothetical protein
MKGQHGTVRHGNRLYWAFVHVGVERAVVWKGWDRDAADVGEPAAEAKGGER